MLQSGQSQSHVGEGVAMLVFVDHIDQLAGVGDEVVEFVAVSHGVVDVFPLAGADHLAPTGCLAPLQGVNQGFCGPRVGVAFPGRPW